MNKTTNKPSSTKSTAKKATAKVKSKVVKTVKSNSSTTKSTSTKTNTKAKSTSNTNTPSTDTIIDVNLKDQYMGDMARYTFYVLYNRAVCSINDGLKPIQRRLLFAMWNDIKAVSKSTKRKSASTVGMVIGQYHAHGDASAYDSMKPMTNPWEIKVPLINYASNSGSIQGGPQAAMRYTESYLSQFCVDYCIGELKEVPNVVDWQNTFDNHTKEPIELPVKVPLLLINGTFAIAITRQIEVPKHSVNDVIDATLDVMHNPNAKVVLIPDPCQPCEIIDADWKKISNTGFGNYKVRGKIETVTRPDGIVYLRILSTPDLVYLNSVIEEIEDLIKKNVLIQIADMQDHSSEFALDFWIILKKGADPEYVKQVLYKSTSLQSTRRVNLEVIVNDEIKRISYKAYILNFLEYRRNVKFRLYNFRLQNVTTRLHEIEIYIKVLESGDVENIIHAIRNQKPSEEAELIAWLMKKLKITDLQAKFVLNTQIKRLSKSSLSKYKEEQKNLKALADQYIKVITTSSIIDAEIEQELIEVKQKYGKPRQSVIISEAQASNIPEGEFKVVVYDSNNIKKCLISEQLKSIRGDAPKCVTVGDNSKEILLFDEVGKVFKLQINKIPFSDKGTTGVDVRTIIKNLTANIITTMYVPILEMLNNKTSKYFIVVITAQGLIKKMDLDDIINATPSGLIYSKINKGDVIVDIIIANHKSDIVIYNKSKALRISINVIPYLKRATLGSISMKTNEPIEGISVVTAETKDVVVVTSSGRFNRITTAALERSKRGKVGSKIIKLTKGAYITNIFTVSKDTKIKCTHPDGTVTEIITDTIPYGSSVSQGELLTKSIVKAELINI